MCKHVVCQLVSLFFIGASVFDIWCLFVCKCLMGPITSWQHKVSHEDMPSQPHRSSNKRMCGLLSYKRICPYTPSRKCVLYPPWKGYALCPPSAGYSLYPPLKRIYPLPSNGMVCPLPSNKRIYSQPFKKRICLFPYLKRICSLPFIGISMRRIWGITRMSVLKDGNWHHLYIMTL